MSAEAPRLVGGAVCLDFVNTVDPRHVGRRVDNLGSYPDFVAWAVHASVIDARLAERLRAEAARRPEAATDVLSRARELREALYRLFSPRVRDVREADVDRLNAELGTALAHRRLAPADGGGWERCWAGSGPRVELDRPLWPIVEAAGELLSALPVDRLRECESDDGCGWLFLDTSKNGRRRWCSMDGCGNRAKARRHRRRSSRA